MKKNWIAVMLLLATLVGVFGCGGAGIRDEVPTVSAESNFIGSKSDSLAGIEQGERPEVLLHFGMTDASGKAEFQIVYGSDASLLLKNECDSLANDIKSVTGVSVPVVHEIEKQKTYEILIGDAMRAETVDIINQYRLDETQFLIRAIDTRVIVYATSEQSVISGVRFLMDALVYKSEARGEYGLEKDYEFVYQPVEHPPITILGIDDQYVEFQLDNSSATATFARMSFTGNGGWRIQTKAARADEYNDFGAAQRLAYTMGEADPSRIENITALQEEKLLTVKADDGSCVKINLEVFQMDFFAPSGELSSTVTNMTTYTGGSSIKGLLAKGEAIFGTGERFDSTNQRGKYIEMFSKDIWSQSNACYMVIPLLCSSRGSGIFVNLYEHMTMDLGKANADEWVTTVTGVPLDVYIYTTERISDVIKAYSDLTGYASMPEEWTYGMIVAAYHPDLMSKWTNSLGGEGVYEMIAHMEQYDLPWTGVLAEAWSGGHKDLKELCDYVHSLGKKFLIYMRVGQINEFMQAISALSSFTVGLYRSDYLLTQTRPDGTIGQKLPNTTAGTNNPDAGGGTGEFPYIDFTNPEACNWFFGEYWRYLMNDIGVDGCKIDFCETLPENYPLNYYDEKIPTSGSHHFYPSAFCSMFFETIAAKPDSGMCYTRGGGIGSQRGPYMWAGDQTRDYTSLAFQLRAVLTSGLSGVPFMSYDMAGYQYGNSNIATEGKILIRGTQFSAFTICLQTHGTVRRSYEFAQEDPNYAYVTHLYRAYTKLHEHLTPYITELSEDAVTTGMPVMRHLVLGWQEDANVYSIDDEYTFGDAFLLAPIIRDSDVRDIYLPEGRWLDLNTGTEYEVGKEGLLLKDYEANLATLPTFYNMDTESDIAPALVSGIREIYAYAQTLLPAAE
jgi:alpha-glucosidase (family GH31 glycosyl hydrolase)